MKQTRYYPYVITIGIMAVFFAVTKWILPSFDLGYLLDIGSLTVFLTAIQLGFTILIIALMKYDGSYLVAEQPGVQFGKLFKPVLAWVIIIFKFVAIFGLLSIVPGDIIKFNPGAFIIATGLAMAIGLFEEFLFRGFLFKNLIKNSDERVVRKAAFISSILFGLFHMDLMMVLKGQLIGHQVGLAWFAFGVGLYFSAVVYRYQKMWIPVTLHALIDVSTFYLVDFINPNAQFDDFLPTLSVTDFGGSSNFPALVVIGTIFLLFGYRMLSQAIEIKRAERLDREAREALIEQAITDDYYPNLENFQPRSIIDPFTDDDQT